MRSNEWRWTKWGWVAKEDERGGLEEVAGGGSVVLRMVVVSAVARLKNGGDVGRRSAVVVYGCS